MMKRRGGGGLNFHAVRDAAVDIYRPPSLLILLPLLPSFSSGSLTVTDALGISPGVLLSFVAKISGKKSTLSRKKEGRKEGNRETKKKKTGNIYYYRCSLRYPFLGISFFLLFIIYFLFQHLPKKYCRITVKSNGILNERIKKKIEKERERREEKWKRNYLSKSDD